VHRTEFADHSGLLILNVPILRTPTAMLSDESSTGLVTVETRSTRKSDVPGNEGFLKQTVVVGILRNRGTTGFNAASEIEVAFHKDPPAGSARSVPGHLMN